MFYSLFLPNAIELQNEMVLFAMIFLPQFRKWKTNDITYISDTHSTIHKLGSIVQTGETKRTHTDALTTIHKS